MRLQTADGERRDHFRVRSGARVEALEPRALLAAGASAAGPVEVQFHAGTRSARLTPGPNQRVALTMRGPGTGTATVSDGAVDLVLEGTTARTTVMVKASGRVAPRLGRVVVRGSLGSFRAPAADVAGDVTFEGPVAEVLIGTTARGATQAPGQRTLRLAPGTSGTVVRLGAVRDLTIDAAGADIASIAVAGWVDDEASGVDRITANSIGTIDSGTTRRNGRGPSPGAADFQADVRASWLGAMTVAGNLSASSLVVMPAAEGQGAGVGSVDVAGSMQGVKLIAMGDIGAVRARGMLFTDIVAGVRIGIRADGTFEHVLPAESYTADFDFTGAYRIGEVAVTGAADPGRGARPGRRRPRVFVTETPLLDSFVQSRIAAYDVGDVLLDAVSGYMASGRQFGVGAYRVGSVLRRFADPSSVPGDFVVRQTSAPLTYHEGPDGYGGYYGNGSNDASGVISGVVLRDGIITPPELPYVEVPAGGIRIGKGSVGAASATLHLMPDGVYELRGASGPLVRDTNLALLVLGVAGVPGTSLKVVHAPPSESAAGAARFRSTSVSDSLDLVLPPASAKPYRVLVPTSAGLEERLMRLPSFTEIIETISAGGRRVDVFDRELLLVRPEGREIGRAFDDRGLRKILLTERNTFRVTGPSGSTLWEGDDLLAALTGDGPRLGERRMPLRIVGKGQVSLYGLARGGTAVFDFGGRQTLDPAGNVQTLLDGAGLAERLRQAGIDFTGHDLQ